MSQSRLDHVAVLGGGVLGGQIAWHSAFKGKTVTVYDPMPGALDRTRAAHDGYAEIYRAQLGASDADIAAARANLAYCDGLARAVENADLVIEAVPEMPEIKTELYRSLAAVLPEKTIIASNSSTLLLSDFAAATGRPDKFAALHFATMIWSANLAEVMAHPGTSEVTIERILSYAVEIGMVPIPVRKEQSGYVLNTWLVAMLSAAQSLVTNGVATPEDIDRSFMILHRGATFGPMGLFDAVGMKTAFDISQHWGEVNGDAQMLANAAFIKEHFLDKGKLGVQSGQGYYSYPDPAYAAEDFLKVPGHDAVAAMVQLIAPAAKG